MNKDQNSLKTTLVALIIIGSFLSYASSSPTPLKTAGYSLTGLSLMALAAIDSRINKIQAIWITPFFLAFLLSTLLSQLANHSAASISNTTQEILYPVCFILACLYGYKTIECNRRIIKTTVIFIALSNALIAILGITGVISSIPLFGPVELGRYIFGTSIPSSNGLTMNVNYFSTVQGSLFLLYGLICSYTQVSFSRKDYFFLVTIASSSLIGSSRGAALGLAASLVFIFFVSSKDRPGRNKIFLLLSILGIALITYLQYQAVANFFYETFRLERGLNSRDHIWQNGLELWQERYILGWGSKTGARLGEVSHGDLLGRSLHSGYVTALASGGLLLFISTYFFIWLTPILFLRADRELWHINRWAVGIIIFYSINTGFRNYAIGGLGLLPILLLISISIIIKYRSSSRNFLT